MVDISDISIVDGDYKLTYNWGCHIVGFIGVVG